MTTLNIRISQEHIIFCAYERLKNMMPEYEIFDNNPNISLNANLHDAAKTVALAKGEYNSVDVYTDGPATLVPLREFEEEDAADLFFFNYPSLKQRHKVFYDTLPYLNTLLLFSEDKDVCRSLKDYFPLCKLHSTMTSLILQFVSRYPFSLTKPRLYCYICENRLWLLVVKEAKLEFLNSYVLHNDADALYYIAAIAQRMGITPTDERVWISGTTREASTLANSLHKIHLNAFLMNDAEELSHHPVSIINGFPYDLKVVLLKAY